MSRSKINWLAAPGYIPETWNPVTGCTPVSAGCANCWARAMVHRFNHIHGFDSDGDALAFSAITEHENVYDDPYYWRKPRMCFICSTGDLFHENVDQGMSNLVLTRVAELFKHRFLILTKRARQMYEFMSTVDNKQGVFNTTYPSRAWPLSNLWLGVSVEDQATADERIPLLLQTPAAVRFVSVEPMLGPIDMSPQFIDGKVFAPLGEERMIDCGGCKGTPVHPSNPGGQSPYCPGHDAGGIDWLIVGCESGPRRRPCDPAWVKSIIEQCDAAGVPVFVKQFDLYTPSGANRVSHDPAEWPEWARRQEWPTIRNS